MFCTMIYCKLKYSVCFDVSTHVGTLYSDLILHSFPFKGAILSFYSFIHLFIHSFIYSFIHSFIHLFIHSLFHRVRKKAVTKRNRHVKCTHVQMIQWLHKTQLHKVKPVDSTPCRITKCELNHNQVDLLKVLPANQTNKKYKIKNQQLN